MVHQYRSVSKAIPAKHLSPMRNAPEMQLGKYGVSISPVDGFLQQGNRLALSTGAAGAAAGSGSGSGSAAYKYNNMVNDNREQFNALHFC